MQSTQAKTIKENIARAKGALSRDHIVKSINALIKAMEALSQSRLLGKEKFEVHVAVEDFLALFNAHAFVVDYFTDKGIPHPPYIKYQPGKEQLLIKGLRFVIDDLHTAELQEEEERQEKMAQRKEQLLETGQQLLAAKDWARARACFRRIAEAYGSEPGVVRDLGKRLLRVGQHQEAASLFKEAINLFPSDSEAYALLVKAFLVDRQYAKAEDVYLMALKQFGPHPRTYLGLAQLYRDWRKFSKAYDSLNDALSLDPNMPEAKEMMAEVEKRVFIFNDQKFL